VADCLAFAIFRAVVLTSLSVIACRVGLPDYTSKARQNVVDAREKQRLMAGVVGQPSPRGKPAAPASSLSVNGDNSSTSMKEPLLGAASSSSEMEQKEVSVNIEELSGEGFFSNGITEFDIREAEKRLTEDEKYDINQISESRKNRVMMLMFLICCWTQIQTGIKLVTFTFHNETIEVICMSVCIVCINAQQFISKQFVQKITQSMGVLFPELHSHHLHYDRTAGHYCDMCRARRIKNSYRCKTCDFDVCVPCFNRKNKLKGEGLLRGDKGLKGEVELDSKTYMKRALAMARPQFTLIAGACICLVATSVANILLPNYQGRILDSVINSDRSSFTSQIQLYIVVTVATGLFGGARSLLFSLVGSRMANAARNKLFRSIIVQDISFFDGTQTGDLMSRLASEVTAMVAPCQSALNTLLSGTMMLAGGLFMCFFTSWRLSVLAITSIGPIIQITRTYADWSRSVNKTIWAAMGDASGIAIQAISNIRTVRSFGTEHIEISRYSTALAEALRRSIHDAYASSLAYALTSYVELGTGVLLLWYGGTLVMDHDGRLSVGRLITFQLYWNMLNNAFQSLAGVTADFTKASAAATRVISMMDTLPDIDPTAGRLISRDQVQGELRLENVTFAYQMRPNSPVLKNLDLVIPRGSVCALVGRSGGGKSTLVHLLMRFYDPQQGHILLDGVPLQELNLRSLHEKMAIVAQDTQLFSGTIEENIIYGSEMFLQMVEAEHNEEKYGHTWNEAQMREFKIAQEKRRLILHEAMVDAAKAANAHQFISELDDGFQTNCGERGVRLSGGQKQRIAIARAMLRRAPLLFLDEATSALDTESEALVQQAIDELIARAGCTVVLVAHRLSTVINADKIAVVDGGRIIEQGSHAELVAQGGAYAKLVARQVSRAQNTLQQDSKDDSKAADVIDSLLAASTSQEDDSKDADVIDNLLASSPSSSAQQDDSKTSDDTDRSPASS